MRNLGCVGLLLAAVLGVTAPASASSITYTFNCTVQNTSPATCATGGGPFGTLTLKDSTIDANRVDVDIALNSVNIPGSTGIDTFYINYDNSVTVGGAVNRTFGLVSQAALLGDHTSAGSINYNSNSVGPFQTTLDVSVDPSLAPGFTWSGSLVIYSTSAGHAESNLDASMFDLKDSLGLLYAAFNTLPSNQNQQYGATDRTVNSTDIAAVPEPGSLLLLGTGLLAAAALVRRRFLS